MMADDVPQWAKDRACELANETLGRDYWGGGEDRNRGMGISGNVVIAFARYIAAHEEPPKDPALEATKRALRDAYGGASPEFVSAFLTSLAFDGFQVTKIVEADDAS
jgi:hypothetical protein